MLRNARPYTGWIRVIKRPPLVRFVLNTTANPQDDAFGWLEYVSGIKKVGVDFLRSRGHLKSPDDSFYLFQSFIRQARAFYISAAALEPRSSPLNYYYAFLNLAKAYILVHQPQFTGRNSNHGLGFKLRKGGLSKQFVTSAKSGVFANFYRQVTGVQLAKNVDMNIVNLLGHCSDISYEYQTGKFGARRMSRGHIAIATDNNECWVVISLQQFEGLEKYRISLEAFHRLVEEVSVFSHQARELFEIVAEHKSEFRFFQSRIAYRRGAEQSIPIAKIIREWSDAVGHLLTVAPYDDAMDFQLDFPLKLSEQLSIKEPVAIYALMYFLSSLVRYNPDFLESLLASRDSWILERFMRAAPVTLLLYMRNLIEGVNCAYKSR